MVRARRMCDVSSVDIRAIMHRNANPKIQELCVIMEEGLIILQGVVEWLFKILHPKGQHPAQLEIELSKEPRNQAFRSWT